MLAETETPALRSSSCSQTALKPCRFCGETTKLHRDEAALEVLWAIAEDATVIRDAAGKPADAVVEDTVSCEACDAFAPLNIWQATPEWLVARAANIAAADAEYDDDGVWQGRVQ